MEFQIGDLVTRNSYDNDTVFIITDMIDGTCLLKGVNVRLCADSSVDDLKKFESKEDEEQEEQDFLNRVKPVINLNRDDYFYLPGKILHIDADTLVSNK